nr:MAG TPA: hypothetical protein [Caudoviricetes sp.]
MFSVPYDFSYYVPLTVFFQLAFRRFVPAAAGIFLALFKNIQIVKK